MGGYMKKNRIEISFVVIVLSLFFQIHADVDSTFHCYLLFGQSNMAGGCKEVLGNECEPNDRVKVLAFRSCNQTSEACGVNFNRQADQWYTATPPYHNCSEGIGPADHFAKVLLDSIRQDITIGFIPCALSGQSINVFKKGSGRLSPNDNWAHQELVDENRLVYDWMLERCQIAQETGVIKGILFHQGEADNGNNWWVGTTKEIFDNLKSDLGLGDIPIVVGELLQAPGACCSAHNPLVNQLASEYPNCAVASSQGLAMRPGDQWNAHFSCDGVKVLGERYAEAFLGLADLDHVPRLKNNVNKPSQSKRVANSVMINSYVKDISIYSINGKVVSNRHNNSSNRLNMKTSGVYIVKTRTNGNMSLVPIIDN